MISKLFKGQVTALIKAVLGSFCLVLSAGAWAHGDVTPHPIDTSALPQLGEEWRDTNPYRGNKQVEEVGAEGYLHNCAGCHGLNAISGGIAPDLLLLSVDCAGMSGDGQESCFQENDEYFKDVVLHGKKTSSGRVTMPGYDGVFTQEAVWAVKAYIDARTLEENP